MYNKLKYLNAVYFCYIIFNLVFFCTTHIAIQKEGNTKNVINSPTLMTAVFTEHIYAIQLKIGYRKCSLCFILV